MRSILLFSQIGCLLPFLIMINLFFGWIFFKTSAWLAIEVILILSFLLNSMIVSRKIFSYRSKKSDVIDVQAEVIQDEE